MQTTLITFRLYCPGVSRVELYGSWDAFAAPYELERDRRKGHGEFVGIFDFHNTLCDGNQYNKMGSNEAVTHQTGLLQGGTYHYYYSLNGMTEYFDPSQPTTTACPILPGQMMNVCEVPSEQPVIPTATTSLSPPEESQSWWTLNPRDRFSALKSRPHTAQSKSIKAASPVHSEFSVGVQSLDSPTTSRHQEQTFEKPRAKSARANSIRTFIRSTFKNNTRGRKSEELPDRSLQTAPSPARDDADVQLPTAPHTAHAYGSADIRSKSLSFKSRDGRLTALFASRPSPRPSEEEPHTSPRLHPTLPARTEMWKALHPVGNDKSTLVQGPPELRKNDSVMMDRILVLSDQPAGTDTVTPDHGSHTKAADEPLHLSLPSFTPLPQLDLSPPADQPLRPTLLRSAFSAWTDTTASTNASASPANIRSGAGSLRQAVSDRSRFFSARDAQTDSTPFASPGSLDEEKYTQQMHTYHSPRDCNSPGPLIMSKGTTTATSLGSPIFSINHSEAASPKFMLAESYAFNGSLDDLVHMDTIAFASSGTLDGKSDTSTMLGAPSAATEQVSKESSRFITPVFVEKSTKRLCQYAGIRDKPMPSAGPQQQRDEPGDYFSCKDVPQAPYRPFNQALEEERELDELRRSVSELMKIVHPHYFDLSRTTSGTRTPGRRDLPPADDDFAEEFSFLRLVVN